MLYQVVIGIAWKCQGIEPKRIDRGVNEPPEVWPHSRQVRQIVVQDIMADAVIALRQAGFHLVQCARQSSFPCTDACAITIADGGKGKDLGRLGIDFDVERHAAAKQLDCRPRQGRCNVQFEPLTASGQPRAFTIASRYAPCSAGKNTDLPEPFLISNRNFFRRD